MDFVTAIQTCFTKYVDFSGRAKRPEYWWFVLFTFLASFVLGLVVNLVLGSTVGASAQLLFAAATLVPSLAVGARRLHDTNRRGWWLAIGLIPIIGALILIYFLVQEGEATDNQYGATPED
jgi:uncharacterized membrane protein YhaH (DUF805 family)